LFPLQIIEIAEFGQASDLGGKVRKTVGPDNSIASASGAKAFCDRRKQTDDPGWRLFNLDQAASIVDEFPRGFSSPKRAGQQQKAEQRVERTVRHGDENYIDHLRFM
jgi:hypothetical protein